MNEFFPIPSCRVEQITHVGLNHLHIAVRGTKPGGRCPNCGRASRAVHSRYQRHAADLPSLGRAVRIGLRVRRFYCRNAQASPHSQTAPNISRKTGCAASRWANCPISGFRRWSGMVGMSS